MEQTEPDACENHELEERESVMRPTDVLPHQARLSRQVLSTSPVCLGRLEDRGDRTTLPAAFPP